MAEVSVIALATTGAVFSLSETVNRKVLLVAAFPSEALTFTCKFPIFAVAGVPLKLRVVALNVNQVGKAVPSSFVAV